MLLSVHVSKFWCHFNLQSFFVLCVCEHEICYSIIIQARVSLSKLVKFSIFEIN